MERSRVGAAFAALLLMCVVPTVAAHVAVAAGDSDPAAIERQESTYAYTDLSPVEAETLLEESFTAQLEAIDADPSRALSEVHLVRVESPTEALVTVGGEPMLLESAVPIRTADAEGEVRKVDLSLEEADGGGYVADNPLVDLELPEAADEPIVVGDDGVELTAENGRPGSTANPVEAEGLFFPEAEEDTGLLLAPVSSGLELSAQLLSRNSPERLPFHVAMPAGATLRATEGGGAEVVAAGGEMLAGVTAPHAVDAQGNPVPVSLAVEGDSLAIEVPHREMDVAYPIFVDPEVVENWSGFTDTSKLNYWNWQWSGVPSSETYIGQRSCIVTCWGNGLYVRSRSETSYGAGSYGRWWLGAPNSTAYFHRVIYGPLHYDAHGCTANEPHGYAGIWNNGGFWSALLTAYPSGWGTGFDTGGGNLGGGARTAFLGLEAASGSKIKCGREYELGGATLYLDDPENPAINSVSGYPAGWVKDNSPFTINLSASDPGLGVMQGWISPAGDPPLAKTGSGCSGHYGSLCPASYNFQWNVTADSFREGEKEVQGSAEDALGKFTTTYAWMMKVDRTPPEVELAGQLARATDETEGDAKDTTGFDKLTLPVYNLTINATDGSNADASSKRSGVKSIEVFLDGKGTPEQTWTQPGSPGSCDSCPLSAVYTLKLNELSADVHHTLRVVVKDYAGNTPRERKVEFEFIPATGMSSEYTLQHFPLPNGQGSEDEEEDPVRPELAVNLVNGNLVYRQQDVEVQGAAADLEVERYYNSLLPSSQDSEFGDGWTLAQTPTLEIEEPEAPGPPEEATIVQESGAVESAVELPTENGEEAFDPAIQAVVTKEPGGYALAAEGGGSGAATVFDEDGEAVEERASGDAAVEFEREAGELSEIAVDDPASTDLLPAEVEEPVDPPAFQSSFGSSGTAGGQLKRPADVAADAAGNLWVVDRTNNRVEKYSGSGQFVLAFGKQVNKTKVEAGAPEAQQRICTAASGDVCKNGVAGSGNGDLSSPAGLAIDAKGNLWVVSTAGNRVDEFNASGEWVRRVGSAGTTNGKFLEPRGIAIDAKGDLWIADSANHRVQELSEAGEFIRAVGTGGTGQLNLPVAVAVGPSGDVWVADREADSLFEYDQAGGFVRQVGATGSGPGQLSEPAGIAVDSQGVVWVTEIGNQRIQAFDEAGDYVTRVGSAGSGSGQLNLSSIAGIEVDGQGRLSVADTENNRVQRWQVPGLLTEYASSFESSFGAFGTEGGQLKHPADVAEDAQGNLWIADKTNNRVEELDSVGSFVLTFGRSVNRTKLEAGAPEAEQRVCTAASGDVCRNGVSGSSNGDLSSPSALAIAPNGDIWVTSLAGNRIDVFHPSGEWVRRVGSTGIGNGQLREPRGIAIDSKGNVWVADTTNHRLEEFNEKGEFLRVAGITSPGLLETPMAVTVDSADDVLVADYGSDQVVEYSSTGSFIRQFGSTGSGNGQFSQPDGIAIDPQERIWVADVGNDRVEGFDASGHYLTQFGSTGSGEGQLDLGPVIGLESDGRGSLWITDAENNRVQEWQAFGFHPAPQEYTPPADDPSVEVETSSGLVESIEGEEAGTVDYTHSGDLLTAASGPEGKTSYQYDAAHRMTKVTLPNGTWGEVAYEATYGRVKSVTVSIEGKTPKTTQFEYTDAPTRSTRVVPAGEAAVTYDVGDDGSVFKWWNAKEPPLIDDIAGNLHDIEARETANPIAIGAYNLTVQAHSPEGITSIQVIANGDTVVNEKNCEKEKPWLECTTQTTEWATETALLPPGILQLEVLVTDRLGQSASERFWVNVPYTPPPDPEAEEPPRFSDIKKFREEFGLDLDLKGNEVAINERIYDLMGAWANPQTPAGEVARSSWERWGVPLRAGDVAELEYRQYYMDHDISLIEAWGRAHQSGTFAGVYISEEAGGLMRVGFTSNQSASIASLQLGAGLVAPDRVAGFTTAPTSPLAALEAAEASIESAEASFPPGLVVSNGIDIVGNTAAVGATDVAQAETRIDNLLGAGAPVTVSLSESPHYVAGWKKAIGPVFAGDFVRSGHGGGCSAGFGAFAKLKSGAKKYFLLSAAHCGDLGQEYHRENESGEMKPLGNVARSGWGPNPVWRVADGEAIDVEFDSEAPVKINLGGGSAITVKAVAPMPLRGAHVCHAGERSGQAECGPLNGDVVFPRDPLQRSGRAYCFNAKVQEGDSGGPVWIEGTHTAVGLTSVGKGPLGSETYRETCATPLLPGNGPPLNTAILTNEELTPIHLRTYGQ